MDSVLQDLDDDVSEDGVSPGASMVELLGGEHLEAISPLNLVVSGSLGGNFRS